MKTITVRACLALVLASVFGCANAHDRIATVKDWSFRLSSDGTAGAYTKNGSGSMLGVYCASKNKCILYLALGTGCDSGHQIPVLLNSSSGAEALTGTCENIAPPTSKEMFVLVLDNFNSVLNIVLKDHTVGFAIPLASGQFKAAHFSLEGSNEALAAVDQSIGATAKPASMKDQIL